MQHDFDLCKLLRFWQYTRCTPFVCRVWDVTIHSA